MKHTSIDLIKTLKEFFPEFLEKDLMENEEICPICHGLGMVIHNNEYGIKGDTSEKAKTKMFPYHHEALSFCPNCFNGVIRKCEYCGKPIKKGSLNSCDCEQYQEEEKKKKLLEYQNTINKAKEISSESNDINCLYDAEHDEFYMSLDDFVDYYSWSYYTHTPSEDFKDFFETHVPKILWNCSMSQIDIDVDSIIENACEDLHEDAINNIDNLKELKDFVHNWCKQQTGTITYYPDYKEYIKVQPDWFLN